RCGRGRRLRRDAYEHGTRAGTRRRRRIRRRRRTAAAVSAAAVSAAATVEPIAATTRRPRGDRERALEAFLIAQRAGVDRATCLRRACSLSTIPTLTLSGNEWLMPYNGMATTRCARSRIAREIPL